MPVMQLKEFLDAERVKYVSISHSTAYTAQEIAASAHVPGRELAETVMVKVDGAMAMAVLPATRKLDLPKPKRAAGAKAVELADEAEFRTMFPQCETGAMPPFGNLYGMPIYIAECLREDVQIAFNAGSHTELIRMDYADFEKLVDPKVATLTS